MSAIPLNITLFRKQFPEFADVEVYPDESVEVQWEVATGYVSDMTGCGLTDSQRGYALNLMTAHLFRIFATISAGGGAGGGAGGVVTSASIDGVSVSMAPPPAKTAWGYWLAQTPYGQMLAAFLRLHAVGGWSVGGLPERIAFRKVGGVFL